ncbi:hypothetical protein K2O51_31095 (plasmid) [Cupriavidus pinatubonensis]|uniref:hypothetical protein n=1 Tax=Cupriavidus pinatubonensis TaxID=248026 RepID=UPI001C7353A7|nr:hypothetical protein [Cupriavidus pinatubonensis]QYY33694.1 hypothetical protein K2O51_31095 [Cupriavidus pinatubonensis]
MTDMNPNEAKPARTPRRWIAAIGGWSPSTGVISLNPKAYDRYPPSTERVWVQEVMADEAAPAMAEEAAPAVAGDWLPTAENVNALPEPIRRHIHDLEARLDRTGEVDARLRDQIRMLEDENERLRAAASAPADLEQPVDVAGDTEDALTTLALELGCFHSTDISSNAGLFVPGQGKAQTDARTAILALFAHVRQGGLVNRPLPAETLKALGLVKATTPAAAPEPERAPKAPTKVEEPQAEQIGLF